MYIPEERMFYDCVDPASGEVMKKRSPFWPDKAQQTLNDVSRPNNEGSLFKDMYQYTKDERFRKVFIDLCEVSLTVKTGMVSGWISCQTTNKIVPSTLGSTSGMPNHYWRGMRSRATRGTSRQHSGRHERMRGSNKRWDNLLHQLS